MAPRRKPLPRVLKNPGADWKPAQLKKLGYKKAGPKAGKNVWVKPGAKPKTPKPTTPKVTDPYAAYADYPAFQDTLRLLDRDQAHHEKYVTGTVAPWLSQALTNLTGVDPSRPGIGPTMQQQYLSNVQGVVGGALNAASAATPMMPSATTPGGLMASPTAYMSTAASEAAQGMRSSALQAAQAQAALGTLQPNTIAQGMTYALADYAKGLPSTYAQRRSEARAKMDQFILEFEEDKRRSRVSEAINAMQAQGNLALGLANLGLDAAQVQARLDESAADMAAASAEANAPVPYGFVRLPDGSYARDPTVPTASSGGAGGRGPSAARGEYPPNKLRKEGFVGGWRVKPKNVKGPFVQATDGTWWRKPASGSGGGKPYTPKPTTNLQKTLADLYKKDDIGGWEERFDGNPEGAGKQIALWVRENKKDFIKGPLNKRKADIAKLRQVLSIIGGRPAAIALDILTRGYINPQGFWK